MQRSLLSGRNALIKIAFAFVVIFVVFNFVRGGDELRQPTGVNRSSSFNEYRLPVPVSASAHVEFDGEPHLLLMTKQDDELIETADLQVISVSPGEEMHRRSWIHTSMAVKTPPRALTFAREHAYVGMTREGTDRPALWVVDFSDPGSPFEANLLQSDMPIYDLVASEDGYMIASGYDDEFIVYDISQPNAPQVLTTFTEPVNVAPKLSLAGSMLIIDHMAGIKFIDVSEPGRPRLVVELEHADWAPPEFVPRPDTFNDGTGGMAASFPSRNYLDTDLDDGHVAIASGLGGVELLDLAGLPELNRGEILMTGGRVVSVGIDGEKVYALGAEPLDGSRLEFRLHEIDVSSHEAPITGVDAFNANGIPRYQEVVAREGNVWILFNQTIFRSTRD